MHKNNSVIHHHQPQHQHPHGGGNDLEGALERGLGVHVTKLGPNEKEIAYAMGKTRVKWFLTGILASLILLSVLVGIYAGLFNDERLKRFVQEKKSLEKLGEEKVDQVRLGITISQQEAQREHQESDTKRALKRIHSVINRKFEELLQESSISKNKLKESKTMLTQFVLDELTDFEKEKKVYDAEGKKRLETLARLQEQSLRELLTGVSGVKMEAMEEMLEEVFAAGQRAPLLEVSDQAVEEIESLADSMYEGKTDLDKGRQRLETIRLQILGTLPAELTRSFSDARDADAFAQALDELLEITKLARGKKEIAAIEENWRKNIDQTRENDNEQADNDEEDVYDEEIKHDVDALLAIHRLVAEGKVPVYLLDFEAIDMKDLHSRSEDEEPDGQQGLEITGQGRQQQQSTQTDQQGQEQEPEQQQQEADGKQEQADSDQQQQERGEESDQGEEQDQGNDQEQEGDGEQQQQQEGDGEEGQDEEKQDQN